MTTSNDFRLLIACLDLTALGGDESPDEIRALSRRAAEPAAGCPPVSAVVVYPSMVSVAVGELASTTVKVAAVAGAFPTGIQPLAQRLAEIAGALAAGAREIDTVLDRHAIAAGEDARAFDEIAASKEACGRTVLKVILETGELGSGQRVLQAAELAMRAGADFLKTSTGKTRMGATPAAARVVMEAIRDHHADGGRRVGFKAAGGIRTPDQALEYVRLCREVLGGPWTTPDLFRIGASGLLDQLVQD